MHRNSNHQVNRTITAVVEFVQERHVISKKKKESLASCNRYLKLIVYLQCDIGFRISQLQLINADRVDTSSAH